MSTSSTHHVFDDTYADSWEDCVVVGEGTIENASTAEHWGGPSGSTMVSLCDMTDGPVTRVRFMTTDPKLALDVFPEGKRFRLKPDERGDFVVEEYHAGQGASDCVIMRVPEITLANAASVEKWVARERVNELFPLGRRFTLEPINE